MSFGFSAHNVKSASIGSSCEHDGGRKSFTILLHTDCDYYGKDRAEITVFAEPSFVPKMERIVASIRAIMDEPNTDAENFAEIERQIDGVSEAAE